MTVMAEVAAELKSKTKTFLMGEELLEARELLKEHLFWYQTLMGKVWEENLNEGPVKDVNVQEVSEKLIELPEGLFWQDLDLRNEETLNEVHEFLSKNYVEDATGSFRLQYTKDQLKWILLGPSYDKNMHFCIRDETKLVGICTATLLNLMTNSKKLDHHGIVNFLCLDKTNRNKRLALILIWEVLRRLFIRSCFQCSYTVARVIPTPYARSQVWVRPLNARKLIEIGMIKAT